MWMVPFCPYIHTKMQRLSGFLVTGDEVASPGSDTPTDATHTDVSDGPGLM